MPINSSDSEALAGLGPPCQGSGLAFVQESQYAGDLTFQGLEALEI